MKEFEKQFNKNYSLPPTIERGPVGRDFKNGCEKMWRVALEWALEQNTWIGNDDGDGWGIDKYVIEEELQDI